MASHYTPDSIYCQQHMLRYFWFRANPTPIRLIRGPVRLRFDTVHVLAIAIRARGGLGCAAKKETL